MRRLLFALLACSLGTMAFAQDAAKPSGDLTDPVEILKKADAAAKAVKAAKYTASARSADEKDTNSIKVDGTVILSGWSNGVSEKWFFDVKVQRPGETETIAYQAGSDGENFFVIDHKNKKAYEDIDPAVLGTNRQWQQRVTMLEYVHDRPFSDEINGEKQELKGTVKIGGEECYHVYVKYSPQQEAEWFFAKKDFLPRQVIRRFLGGDTPRPGSVLTVTSLSVDPPLSEDAFSFKLPAGFEKVDDFAP